MINGVLARAFFHSGRFSYLASTVFHSAAANSLCLADLRAGIREHWQPFANTEAEATAGLFAWEERVASARLHPGASVLMAGCGSGREVFPLAERGCRVVGVDPATDALGVARTILAARGLQADLMDGFIDELVIPGRFDAIWFGNTSYSLIPEAARRVRTLRRFSGQLSPGGFICLDHQSPLARPRPLVIRAARAAGRLAGSDWRLEDGDLVGWKQQNGAAYYSYAHAFVPEEIEREASLAGLRIVERFNPPDVAAYVLEPIGR